MFFTNGYIIQTQEDSPNSSNKEYNGISRKISWPLDAKYDEEQKELETQWIDNFFAQEPMNRIYEFIFDTSMLSRYKQKCIDRNIIFRILYLETVDPSEHFSQKDFVGQLLGYELIYPSGNYYSALNEELELIQEAGLSTNAWGLLTDEEDLDKFISWKMAQTINTEPLNEFVKAKIYLIQNFSKEE